MALSMPPEMAFATVGYCCASTPLSATLRTTSASFPASVSLA